MAVPFENRNFHKEMLKLAGQLQKEGKVPRLLLHSCCAPCSSNCIEVLSKYFMVTVFYYNPNISSDEEYKKRVAEQISFIPLTKLNSSRVITNRMYSLRKLRVLRKSQKAVSVVLNVMN